MVKQTTKVEKAPEVEKVVTIKMMLDDQKRLKAQVRKQAEKKG